MWIRLAAVCGLTTHTGSGISFDWLVRANRCRVTDSDRGLMARTGDGFPGGTKPRMEDAVGGHRTGRLPSG